MISYDPLFRTIKRKNLLLIDLVRECKLAPATVAKFKKNQSVTMDTIDKVCCYLNVPIEEVVSIKQN
ncbi:helix-turn-helix domain-containing protein [Brevibacillus borstelensis]|uniref:helix-turn-helix domain-containing protein n=1 Tax=Brevibacillus borstelensis TaxID=45462 RepID=UPI003BB00F5A